jgi:serine-type D-Ala-D-Ala carboxypeptidase (penicillin-binding protein 5/6)
MRRFLIALAGVMVAAGVAIPVYASTASPHPAAASAPRSDAHLRFAEGPAPDQHTGAAALPTTTPIAPITPTPLPTPTQSPVPGPAGIKIAAGALENARTGKLLWYDNLDKQLPIGSIVKVMTAILVLKADTLNRVITVPESVIAYLDSQDQPSVAGLIVGDKLTTQELLEAMLLPSGCDAAYTLALAYGPGIKAFVASMNAEAAALGLTGTHFTNFDGMPWPTEHSEWSTPADLIKLGQYAMRFPVFRQMVGQPSYTLPAGDGHHAYLWLNANPLVGTFPGSDTYAGAIGIKTGDTKAAKLCILFEATRNGVTLIGVTLGTPGDNINEVGPVATKVLNWGFAHV